MKIKQKILERGKVVPLRNKNDSKRINAVRFVEATQALIDAEGLEGVSVRKIAARAGFHNSTIYLYFNDINELILLASLKHFRDYSRSLSEQSKQSLSPRENFYTIWETFAKTVFRQPQIFYNFFFGKYSDNLTPIITQYYELFPEEKEQYSKEIEDMYYSGNIKDRCLKVLLPLIGLDEFRVTQKNLEIMNDIIVSCLKSLLEEACSDSKVDSQEMSKKLLDMIQCIINI